MSSKEIDFQEPRYERRDILLWLGLLAGPFAWFLHQQASYLLMPTACQVRSKLLLHLAFLAAVAIVTAGGANAWRLWKKLPEGSTEKGENSKEVEHARSRFMALAGLTSCLFFGLVILATEVPNLILRVCD